MNRSYQTVGRFFRVMVSGQAYLKNLYLLVAFPLGVFYFVFLVTGLSLGFSLSIIWVGIPILVLVGAGWWALASFERFMVVHGLHEDLPPMFRSPIASPDTWTRFKEYLANPKSLLYLFMKFPLGIFAFVVQTTLISLTLAFLAMPFMFKFLPDFQVGIFLSTGLPTWPIDSLNDALLAALIGLMLWPITLHITNGLAWVYAKFAAVMLSVDPMGQ